MLLGLSLAGSGLVGIEPLSDEATEGAHLPARAALPGSTTSPLAVGDRFPSDLACHPSHRHAPRPDTVFLASIDDNPRQYLRKMAALRFRRLFSTPTALDPYQASLNPALYFADDATPMALARSRMSVPNDELCRYP